MAAADALAGLISDEELSADYIIPKALTSGWGPPWRRPLPRPPAAPAWLESEHFAVCPQ